MIRALRKATARATTSAISVCLVRPRDYDFVIRGYAQEAATVCDQLTHWPLKESTTPASLSLYRDDAILSLVARAGWRGGIRRIFHHSAEGQVGVFCRVQTDIALGQITHQRRTKKKKLKAEDCWWTQSPGDEQQNGIGGKEPSGQVQNIESHIANHTPKNAGNLGAGPIPAKSYRRQATPSAKPLTLWRSPLVPVAAPLEGRIIWHRRKQPNLDDHHQPPH